MKESPVSLTTIPLCFILWKCSFRAYANKFCFCAELSTPNMEMANISINSIDEQHCNATIEWNNIDTNFDDIEYIIEISNSSTHNTMKVNDTVVTIKLYESSIYAIKISSQRCDGNLSSNESQVLNLSCPAASPSPTQSPTLSPPTLSPPLSDSSLGQYSVWHNYFLFSHVKYVL